jgi:RNA polymerase sigma factor (sigma-70 family)
MLETEPHRLVEKLYLDHHKKLIKFAYNFSSDYDLVSEIVQSTYLTLLEFNDINKITTDNNDLHLGYIYMIIKNMYFKQMNYQKRYPLLPLHLDVEEVEYDMNSDVEFEQKHKLVISTVSQLDYDYKRVWELTTTGKYTVPELSRVTGIAETTLNKMIKKVINTIQTKYTEDSREIPGYKPQSNINHNNRRTRRIKLTV